MDGLPSCHKIFQFQSRIKLIVYLNDSLISKKIEYVIESLQEHCHVNVMSLDNNISLLLRIKAVHEEEKNCQSVYINCESATA